MSGPEQFMGVAWAYLQKQLEMDEPFAATLYLGCKHSYSNWTSNDNLVQKVLYDMTDYLCSSDNLYQRYVLLQPVKKPRPEEWQHLSSKMTKTLAVAKAPKAKGPCIECEWCGGTFPDNGDCKYACYDLIKKKNAAAKKDATVNDAPKCEISNGEESATDSDIENEDVKGALHKAASSILMKILYAARMARPDQERPTTRLASYVTKWSAYRGNKNYIV